ncbi:feruloyl esterase B-1 [Melanomma pulvis-pyrius CBS 109.77]|uniref:Carboxylic ester hydrolase n=1 Tax=Melanomma pulvis-pyrius CBS 109.77 TaxID=1314802 RepID=A0A6A6X4N3_9PLEO|nr:feruloyl esterase B-1 [Melanomma pulvis-pyrius CBS 109.77]
MYISSVSTWAFGLLVSTAHGTPAHPKPQSFSSKCTSFGSSLHIGSHPFNVTIAQYLPAASVINTTAEGSNVTCAGYNDAPPISVNLCRIGLTVKTEGEGEVILETWLPEEWNGRFLSAGNGGFAGCIQYQDIAYGVSYGFATVGTNNGHNGTSAGAFFHQPEVLRDFVWRALYTGVEVGKDITKQFYHKESCKSYYIGCSTGGRQGWKAAQAYPELFDGIIAGAPAIAWNGQLGWFGEMLTSLGTNTSATWLDAANWAAVQEEVMAQCDGLDGAVDGILEDTRKCRLDVTPLLCSSNGDKEGCLSQIQAETMEKVFSPFLVDGEVQHSGASHGYESALYEAFVGPLLEGWLQEWYAYVVYQDLSWTRANFSIDDVHAAFALNPYNVQTFDTDLSAFRDLGGKILHWHGQADQLLAVGNSDRYYDSVKATMNATSTELDEFYRYFRISGINHCFGGPGAGMLGQGGGVAAGNDPDDNMLMRIVAWVEEGAAPEFVRGTKFVNDTPSLGVEFTRRHCKHPAVNVYTGTGNGTDEAGWTCVEE